MLLTNVLAQISNGSAMDLANIAAGAAGLRALAAEHALHSGELPDGSDDAAQQRRRRNEV
jgi:hypothetical protein